MIYYRFENKNKKRYYKIILSRDLFNEWVITKVWGSLNNASGRIVHIHAPSYETSLSMIEKLIKLRKKRGYELCG